MSPKKVGWADDIVAPRQEINTLSLLYEQEAIQSRMPKDLAPSDFLAAYREVRRELREQGDPTSPGSARTAELTQKVAVFGAKASTRARREPGKRWMLSCVGPDEPGVLASLTSIITAKGGNIEGAVMSLVAGHLVTVLFVEGAEAPAPGPQIEAYPKLIVDYTRIRPADADWPRPGSNWWHARARGRADVSPLLNLTAALAHRTLPLITMSSWREPESPGSAKEVEIVDLNLAVAPDPEGSEIKTIREIEAEITGEGGGTHIDVLPARWPTQHRSQGENHEANHRDVVMTVVGHAEPGFVNTVLTTLVEGVTGVLDIRGTSMEILDGMTVLVVVFRRAKGASVKDLKSEIRKQVTHGLQSSELGAPLAEIQIAEIKRPKSKPEDLGSSIHKATHQLRLEVPEQSRVVMKVASQLHRSEVNVTWFVAHVREPTVGERWPICDIHMHLHIEPEQENKVDAELRSLAEREGWEEIRLDKWSVRR